MTEWDLADELRISVLDLDRVPEFRLEQARIRRRARQNTRAARIDRLISRSFGGKVGMTVLNVTDLLDD